MKSKISGQKRTKCRDKQPNESELTAYWEARLKRMHLTMDAGSHIGTETICYGHSVLDLDYDGRITYKPPTGERLDNKEWPISLC
jgi:hypothetical protein